MAKKHLESSLHGKQILKNERFIRDEDIDYSDLPELTDEELKKFKPIKQMGRPFKNLLARKAIAIRLDQFTLAKIKKLAEKNGKGYQTLINEILTEFVSKKTA